MKTKNRKKKAGSEESHVLDPKKLEQDRVRKDYQAGHSKVSERVRQSPVRELVAYTLSERSRITLPPEEDEQLLADIDNTLRRVESARAEAHAHDEDIARLGEETRRLITEMMRDLNLKAA